MPAVVEMRGVKVGHIEVLSRAPNDKAYKSALWNVRCDCGRKFRLNGSALRSGHTKSCGCRRNERRDAGVKCFCVDKSPIVGGDIKCLAHFWRLIREAAGLDLVAGGRS
jgi:hypothetical protein